MTKTHRTIVLAGALMLAATAMLGFRAGRSQAEPTSIGVVDLFSLINQLDEWKEVDARLNAKAATFEREINNAVDEMKRSQEEIKAIQMDKEEEFEKRAALLEKNNAVEAAKQRSRLILQFLENVEMIRMYDQVTQAAEELALEQGFDLVLIRSDTSSFGPLRDDVPPQQLRELMVYRQMLYVSESVDITAALAQKMNNNRMVP